MGLNTLKHYSPCNILNRWKAISIVKEFFFTAIKQGFGRFEKQWRYKKGENEPWNADFHLSTRALYGIFAIFVDE